MPSRRKGVGNYGLTAFIKSNVIIIVTTGTVGGEARRYAKLGFGQSDGSV